MITSKNLLIKLNNTKEHKHRIKLINQILDMQLAYHKSKGNIYQYNLIYVPKTLKGIPTLIRRKMMYYSGYYIAKDNTRYSIYNTKFEITNDARTSKECREIIYARNFILGEVC